MSPQEDCDRITPPLGRHTSYQFEAYPLDPVVAVLATLDTKGSEAAFLARCLADLGLTPWLVDLGLRGEPLVRADVPRGTVAAGADPSAGTSIVDERERAMAVMASGAGRLLVRLHEAGELQGVIGIGGSKGTWISTAAMRSLPWGVPKVMVASTVAGDLRRYTGHRDIAFIPTVVDLAGLNGMTRLMLTRGAAVLHGIISVDVEPRRPGPAIAMSMAGVVTPLGQRVQGALADRGVECVVFPANGAGGMALEEAIAAGRFGGVIDIALLELANDLVGGICSAGPDRLAAAGRAGLPQVIVPGAIEFANFGEPSTVPAHLRSREVVEHTPVITLVRLTKAESATLGAAIAAKLNDSRGPVELLLPMRGFSAYDRDGGAFDDPEADRAFTSALRERLNGNVTVNELDLHVNDAAFADAVFAAAERLIPMGVAA